MAEETIILQHWLFTKFLLPFLLVFLIAFAILEKTKVIGGSNKQLNALVSFVIGFIFVGVAGPGLMVSNLMLFLGVALVIIFVVLLIWGAVTGGDKGLELIFGPSSAPNRWVSGIFFALLILVVAYVSLWAAGINIQSIIFDPLFNQAGSEAIWTNVGFVVIIALALALVLRGGAAGHN